MPIDREEIITLLGSIYPFYQQDPQKLDRMIHFGDQYSCHAGQIIYQEGGEAESLFIVLDGTVQLKRTRADGEQVLVNLQPGDIFGFEMLDIRGVCLATAAALNSAELFILDRDRLLALVRENPGLIAGMEMLFESYRLALKVRLDWINPTEVIYFISRRHPVYLLLRLIPPLMLGSVSLVFLIWFLLLVKTTMLIPILLPGLGLLFTAGWLVWAFVDWGNDYTIITNQRVVFQERVVLLYDSRQEAPINAVLAVSTDTGQLGRWFGFGDVTVRTYAGIIKLPNLRNPKEVATIVRSQSFRAGQLRESAERKEMEEVLRKRIGKTEDASDETRKKEIPAQMRPGFLQALFANLVRMRFEKNGVITYRTHWLILFKRIFFPLTIMILIIVAMVFGWVRYAWLISPSVVTILGVFLIFFDGIWLLYQYVDWRNDYYVISDDQVLDVYKKPLAREERRAAPLKNIQSVEFERLGLIGQLVNFGTVYIRVGDTLLTFDEVYNPSEVQQELFKRIAEVEYRERQAAQLREKERMVDMFEIYHRAFSAPNEQMDDTDTGREDELR